MGEPERWGDFYKVDGFIIYHEIVVEDHLGIPSPTREAIGEAEEEEDAKKLAAEKQKQFPDDAIYYEPGRILV